MHHPLVKPLAVLVPSGAATYSTVLSLDTAGASPAAVGAIGTAALGLYLVLLALLVDEAQSRIS